MDRNVRETTAGRKHLLAKRNGVPHRLFRTTAFMKAIARRLRTGSS